MLQEQFDILGFYGDYIYFAFLGKIIVMHKRLPKEDMILKLKVEPEDVKPLRDEILVECSNKALTYSEKEEILELLRDQEHKEKS